MSDAPSRLVAALADRYRIERELGQGGMATVYLAQDLKHHRQVAIKVLRPELAAVIGAERFLAEITTTANLQHPHILPLHDSGTVEGTVFYVMPFIAGESLRDRLDREKQLPVNDAVRIAGEVAGALDYAHRHGVIHRDIKPENILLHDGRALVADFGIALAASRTEGSSRMTETGMSLGTPHYMSPEQALGERNLDARTDIYALGCVLYEMLTGEPPFSGPTAQAIIAKVMSSAPEPVTVLRRTVPPHVAAAVQRAIEKLPADRYATAAEFAAGLSDLTGGSRMIPGTTTGGLAAANRWRRVAVGAGALAGVALLALAWLMARPLATTGPREYDVGLPDSASIRGAWDALGFAVSPAGDFVVYQADHNGTGELWYRSLTDATARRIDGTVGGVAPAISPDGTRIAFLRVAGGDWTLEVMPLGGGGATVLARGNSWASMEWLADGRILVIEGDGIRARWLDPGGGPTTTRRIAYCIMPAPLPDPNTLLCGGGGSKFARQVDIRDSLTDTAWWTAGADSTPVFGAQFRVIDGRYVVYTSMGGDLLAASWDPATNRVGRAVRMVTGIGRRAYTGSGNYAVSQSGTLVYANGINQAVGNLVRATDRAQDTLPVERDAFLRFSVSPDGRSLAAVVEGLDGEQLRIYDLGTGKYQVWLRAADIAQPVWSPAGDRMALVVGDSLLIGSAYSSGPPERVAPRPGGFEGFTWTREDRLIGVDWPSAQAIAVRLDQRPVVIDTLVADASFVTPSPDGKWLAYNSADITELWIEPLPATGRRTQVATGNNEDPQWLSNSEFVFTSYDAPIGFERVTVSSSANGPVVSRRRWFEAPRLVGTPGQTFAVTPDGRILYVEGAEVLPTRYLRVIPNWVSQMKRAVDEANR